MLRDQIDESPKTLDCHPTYHAKLYSVQNFVPVCRFRRLKPV